jgi:hypothetical protein
VKLQRYNENWLQIIYRLTGYKPLQLSQRDLLMLDTIFNGVCLPFDVLKPQGRKNLLNYNFLLYRLLQLAGRKDTLCHFPQLKTKSKWEDMDRTWAKICEYNDWEHWPIEPAPEGKSQWLEIPTDDAFWATCFKEQMMASWASCENASRPKKAKAHTYANKQILHSMHRGSVDPCVVAGSTRICTDLHGSARICTDLHGSARICTDLHGSARIRSVLT